MNYGIPYMGSKSGIVERLCEYMLYRHPNKKYFIDACCGGLAVSHYVTTHSNLKIFANDLDSDLIVFYKDLFSTPERRKEIFESYGYSWIDSETYKEKVKTAKGTEKVMLMSVWSFGNKYGGYLYGKDIRLQKELLHNLIVEGNEEHLSDYFKAHESERKESIDVIRKWYSRVPQSLKTIDYRKNPMKRVAILADFKKFIKLEIEESSKMLMNGRIQNIERFERITELENQARFERITFSSIDCIDFLDSLPDSVIENSIVYLDPPYKGTADYSVGETNVHERIKEWALKKKCPIYVSEYSEIEGMENCFYQMKNQTLNNTSGKDKARKELLLYNNYPEVNECLGDLIGYWDK